MNARERYEDGFTLTELLVVLTILALLAAIAIPAFFGQRDKAKDAEAKAHARTAQLAAEAFATGGEGDYTGISVEDLVRIEPTLSEPGEDLTVIAVGGGEGYEIAVKGASTGNEFKIERDLDGSTSYTCTQKGTGGCPDSGFWGG